MSRGRENLRVHKIIQEEAQPAMLLKRLELPMDLLIMYGGDILFSDITCLCMISGLKQGGTCEKLLSNCS